MIIYKITNLINGKVYIGQTIRTIKYRWSRHKRDINKYEYPLYKAMRKYGIDNFKIETIAECKDQEELDFTEQEFIECYRNRLEKDNVYNIANGGYGKGKVADETKLKISKIHKGMKRSIETKRKMSISALGNKNAEGTIPSAETREKIRQTKLGDKNPNYGKPISEKRKANLYEAQLKNSKLVRCIETGEVKPMMIWKKELNDNTGKIHRVCIGQRKHTRGLSFEYVI